MKLRKWHGWIGLIVSLPLALITLTGIVLQLRNQFEWIQPKSVNSEMSKEMPLLTFEAAMKLSGDEKVDQVIYRPEKRNLAIRLKNGEELQVHPQTGEVLKRSMRRTNFLIDLHQGTWLGSFGQYFIHFVTGLGLAILIVTGIWIYPFKKRRFL